MDTEAAAMATFDFLNDGPGGGGGGIDDDDELMAEDGLGDDLKINNISSASPGLKCTLPIFRKKHFYRAEFFCLKSFHLRLKIQMGDTYRHLNVSWVTNGYIWMLSGIIDTFCPWHLG